MTQCESILLVEDNEDDVFALKWAMKKAGIEVPVTVVTDGQQAVDYLAASFADNGSERPDLVLLDLKLPYLSGHEVLQWIRSQSHLDDVKVVILSGSDQAKDHERAETLGAAGYLVKPPSREDLLQVLALCTV